MCLIQNLNRFSALHMDAQTPFFRIRSLNVGVRGKPANSNMVNINNFAKYYTELL
jgi:hypothetical protein